MEDLETLETALSKIEPTEAEQNEGSDYEGLYKNWGKQGSQEERRKEQLEIQKGNRNNKIDKFRGIWEIANPTEDTKTLFEPFLSVEAHYRPKFYVSGFHKTCQTNGNVLMLSEWMLEKPGDFSENWYVVPCPKGIRLVAIASQGTTKFYTKLGHLKFNLYTGLPGGSPYNCFRRSSCMLDCIYYEKTNTLYLLDIIAWNNTSMIDGETEFRHYWMKTQLEDFPDTKTINKKNKVIFEILPMMPCTDEFLTFLLSTYPYFDDNSPPLDGLLFYHKRAHYVAGETPLVGWLYPYMIPEVLGNGVTIHPDYMSEMPEGYTKQSDFIVTFEAKKAKKAAKRVTNKRRRGKDTWYYDPEEAAEETADIRRALEALEAQENGNNPPDNGEKPPENEDMPQENEAMAQENEAMAQESEAMAQENEAMAQENVAMAQEKEDVPPDNEDMPPEDMLLGNEDEPAANKTTT